jgi:hypothetical protein
MAFFENLLRDPVGQMAIVPFAIGFVVALIVRLMGGAVWGNRLAAIGIGAGAVVA